MLTALLVGALTPPIAAFVAPPETASGPVVAESRTYRAVRTTERMDIDGRAHEKVWKRAPLDNRFTERQPELGGKPELETTLRVAYDDLALYFLIDCEGDPEGTIVRTLRRDSWGIFSDDTVVLKIDAHHDNRTSVSLGINADGAQVDTMALENGRVRIREWDAVWEAETAKTDRGWSAEFRIPFSILGIKGSKNGDADLERTIGLDISRDNPKRNSTYDWKLIVPPQSPIAASAFGDLTGLKGIKARRALEILPYGLLRTDFTQNFSLDPRTNRNLAVGGDARIQVGRASYIEASLFTDFAQVEADEVQVATDRFPLFFPERRPFFINGLDVFNFGQQREAQMFFSRRVGLDGGTPIPILGGAKAYGRAGPISYGVLNVQTMRRIANDDLGLEETPPENYSVARMRVQTTKNLNMGVMALGRHTLEVPNADHFSGGADAQVLAAGGKFQWYSFVSGTFNQVPEGEAEVDPDSGEVIAEGSDPTRDAGTSASTRMEWRGLYVRPSFLWLYSDDEFDPQMGFYRRPGTARHNARVRFAPRPRIWGLRDVQFGPRYDMYTDPGYTQRITSEATGEYEMNWRNGSNIKYDITQFIDEVQDDFELYQYTVEAGRYTGLRHMIQYETPGRRALRAKLIYRHLDLFGGIAHQPSLELTARLGKHFTFRGRYTHLVGHMLDREETFNFGFLNGNVDVAINRNLLFDNLVRLDLSPGNERFGLQSRIRWRFLPGSDLFIVYRGNVPLGPGPVGEGQRTPFHEVTVKFTYYLRALLPG